ncbi:MAG TPA: sigma-54 dependent transcriptional regulator [Bdellovibrionales bacterium]|nr:sigma-54 dependent transcriptional regulator [Bdellovibrionales bacterium]
MLRVLVVDDDQGLRFSVRETLAQAGQYEIDEAFDGMNAIEKVRAGHFDVVLLDVDMPRLNGLEALKLIKEHDPSIVVLIMTAFASIDDAVRAVKEGAYNYLSKPVKADELVKLIDRAVSAQQMISNIAASAPVMMEAGRKIIGNTSEMQKVFNIINRLSKVETPVLIRGASGTGKELVARAIHFNSGRKDEKFVAINCSAIPENLFESELFGHEKGSFTGAHERKIGKFQFAEGGTLFLDEMGEMPITMQVKLLRVLQERMFTPVGSNREIEANVRVIAATNRPLEQMITEGKFREDLFYRLNVVPIFLPALAERKKDIDTLVNGFIKKFNKAHSKRIIGITPDAMNVIKKYSWPGNIRELENVIEHAFILENGNTLTLASLPESVLSATGTNLASMQAPTATPTAALAMDDEDADSIDTTDVDDSADIDSEEPAGQEIVSINGEALDFNKHKEAFEREFIIKALKTFKGRINQTALHANIPKKTLLRKIEKYGIIAKDYSDKQ